MEWVYPSKEIKRVQMRITEAELHQMLDEIAPNSSSEEQARIVAEAVAIFERDASRKTNTRTASRINADMIRESAMADAILQAIGAMDDWSNSMDGDDYAPAFIDGRGLGGRAIISQVVGSSFRGAAADVWGDMDILNDDLDQFLDDDEEEKTTYTIEDEIDAHCPETFFAPGRGRHRSDSQAR
jgi:hypothetical protein